MAQRFSTQFPQGDERGDSETSDVWGSPDWSGEQAIADDPFADERAREFARLDRSAPSLSIILISAACGIGAGIVGFYFAFVLGGLGVEISAGLATVSLCFGLGLSGALLSSITGSRAAVGNILLSCGLIALVLLFFTLCMLTGAIAATLLIAVGG